MARQVVSLRLDEELLGWATAYAAQRGVSRTELLETGLRSFRVDCDRGVPEFRERAARQAALAHSEPTGVGQCPDRPEGLGHVWKMGEDRVNRCSYCGHLGREFLERATKDRTELFSRLRTPDSAKGVKVKS